MTRTREVPKIQVLRDELIAATDSDPEVRVWWLARLDAFESAIRRAEGRTIAAALREAERNPSYALHQQATLGQIAEQIEGMRR